MPNASFDAALLLRGLRAMDAALGETYDVANHTCVPSPVVYASEFPKDGIDFAKYQGGFEGIKGVWKGWMYEDGGKGKLKTSVHEDVEATVVEAFDLFGKLDANKDGRISKDEWEKGQKSKKADDQLFDLEYLTALQNVTAKMTELEKNTPLNPADPETYPEVIALKGEKSALETQLVSSKEETALYKNTTIGLGAFATLALVLGLRALLRGRSTAPKKEAEKKPEAPKTEAPKTETKKPEASDNIDDILNALNEGETSPANSFQEILTYPVNDAEIEKSLRLVSPELADFYRAEISTAAHPVTTMSDLLARIVMTNPKAMEDVQAALAGESRPATEMPERVVFELVARHANWAPSDPAMRPAAVVHFEKAARFANSVERKAAPEAEPKKQPEARKP